MELYIKVAEDKTIRSNKCIVYDYDNFTARLSTTAEEAARGNRSFLPVLGQYKNTIQTTRVLNKYYVYKDLLWYTGDSHDGESIIIQGNRLFIVRGGFINQGYIGAGCSPAQRAASCYGLRGVVRLSNHEVLLDLGLLYTLDTETGLVYRHRKTGVGLGYTKGYSICVGSVEVLQADRTAYLRSTSMGTGCEIKKYNYKEKACETASCFREMFRELGYIV